jgi:transposase
LFPWLPHSCADSAYNGPAFAKFGNWTVEIVKRAADAAGVRLLPRRWVSERTLALLTKDFEASMAKAKAWVYVASVQLFIRRLA